MIAGQARIKPRSSSRKIAFCDDEEEFAYLLRALGGDAQAIQQGRALHHVHLVHHARAGSCTYLANLLIQMYGKCGAVEDARAVFNQLEVHRNVYSWTLAMGAYAQHSHRLQVLQLYEQMLDEGAKPDKVTFIYVLGACSSMQTLYQIHRHIAATGFLANEVVRNALLHTYGKCGSPQLAQVLFDVDRQHTIFWNSIIGAHTQHGQCTKALVLYQQMLQEGVAPDKVTLVSALSASSSLLALSVGKQFHTIIKSCEFESDVVLGTALIKMYDKCTRLVEARSIFDDMQQRDVVVWNSMLSAYAQHGMCIEAFKLYKTMKESGLKPNEVTFISVLGACTSLADLAQGKSIHSHLEKYGFDSDVIVGTALVHMYGKCEQLEDARRVFLNLSEQNVVSWTAIIEAHAVHGQESRALDFYKQMLHGRVKPNMMTFVSVLGACTNLMDAIQGKEIHASIVDFGFETNVLVGTALIKMYSDFAEVGSAKKVFDIIQSKSVMCWTTLFTAYFQQGYAKEALLLYQQMLYEGLKPDKYLLINVVEACASLAILMQSEEIHATVIDSGLESDVAVGTALIDMYGKCGSSRNAWCVFERIDTHNVLSWTALIAANCHVGHVRKALYLFEQMQKDDIQPDAVTFLSILSGCSHVGLVDEGLCCFHSMIEQHKFAPTLEHYACTVDLIGRAGRLEETVKFILQMPVIPGLVVWKTLLSVCKLHDDGECGKWAAQKISVLNPNTIALYVVLSNLCATDMVEAASLKLSNFVL